MTSLKILLIIKSTILEFISFRVNESATIQHYASNVTCNGCFIIQRCHAVKQEQHYGDVIMGTISSQITSLTIVYSTVYSDADQRKHQSSASLAFARGIHRGPVNSPHKWPVTRKIFPFDDVIMKYRNTYVVSGGNRRKCPFLMPLVNSLRPSDPYIRHQTNILVSDNGLSPGWRQAIIWISAGVLLIGPLGTNFSEISIHINIFSFKKIHLIWSSAKWRPFCLDLNVLTSSTYALQI